jgi:dTDP-4-amino-4,6-dideoxygalactose transaminase
MMSPNRFVQLSKPFLGESEISIIQEVLGTGYLGMGKYVSDFEALLSNFFGREVVCVSSGTAALHLSLEALDIGPGDEVLVPSLTYVATFQAVAATGAIPVPCDINEDDLTVNLVDAASVLSEKTKAIIPVHYAGYPGNLGDVYRFAESHRLRVIEDAAHAFGSHFGDALVGSIGDIVCFSFDPIKNITCGDGGAVVTRDRDVTRMLRSMRQLGLEEYDGSSKNPVVNSIGWRYHMNNISAALGIAQFSKLDELRSRKQVLAQRYVEKLASVPGVKIMPCDFTRIMPYLFVVRLPQAKNVDILDQLAEVGVQSGCHYYPCHLLPFFRRLCNRSLPIVESIYDQLLSLPFHAGLSIPDIDYVTEMLGRILANPER